MHNKVFPSGGLIYAGSLKLEISNTIFAHNQITPYGSNNNDALVIIDAPLATIVNVTFQNNFGMGIYINSFLENFLSVSFINLRFINNTGVNAAGIFMDFIASLTVHVNCTNVLFQSNHYISDYGGGIFIQTDDIINNHFDEFTCVNCSNKIDFQDEQQGISSNKVENINRLFPNIPRAYWRLPASFIKVRNVSKITTTMMFPGKLIPIPPLAVTDWVNNKAKCSASLSIANHTGNSSCKIDIRSNSQGSISILLESTRIEQIKPFYFISTHECLIPQTEITLSMECENASALMHFTLRECSLGYIFDTTVDSMGTCQQASDQLAYDKDTGTVCVQNSNWYGQMSTSDTIISSCTDPYCASGKACPIIGFTDTHQTLPWTQDEQCKGL